MAAMNKTSFAPVALFPLPLHHGLVVLGLFVVGMVALYVIGRMITTQPAASDGLFS